MRRWLTSLGVSTPVKRAENLRNPVGIYLLDEKLRKAVFGPKKRLDSLKHVDAARKHLRAHDLLGRGTTAPRNVNIEVPSLLGDDLEEHFQKIGRHMSEPYLGMSQRFIRNEPAPVPHKWILNSGWMRYSSDGTAPVPVEHPLEAVIVFDVEVLYNIHEFAVLATAVSDKAFYSWISPWLLGETSNERQLIPLGTHEQVVIGHNVGYDRKRVKEEYSLKASKKFFMDTMSLHIATNGMCSQQRPTWMKLRKSVESRDEDASDNALDYQLKNEPWFFHATKNSLAEVVEHNLNIKVDKSERDLFGILDREGVCGRLNELLSYCARDVLYTKSIFNILLPGFLKLCPHPISFGALRSMSSQFLPVNEEWEKYAQNAESLFQKIHHSINDKLADLAATYANYVDSPDKMREVETDPWLKQLDWEVKPIRYVQPKRKGEEKRIAKNQKMPGKPKWFKDLFPKGEAAGPNLTVRSRVTPLLLRLQWDGNPLQWYDEHGWSFWVAKKLERKYRKLNFECIAESEEMSLFKLPHPSGGSGVRCTNPLAKSFVTYFESGVLTSENPHALVAIRANTECSYWISSRKRVFTQMPVYQNDVDMQMSGSGFGMILPRVVPMGTVTRRSVEDLWLTASNAKKSRIGSELKAMVRAPPGYKIVGADVDSEELWIASLVGDALFGVHGGTALGWMTLEGSKSDGTDLHCRTSQILGISRNEAKIFNYGRIYGAGKEFATRLLKHFDPNMSMSKASETAAKLYYATKGAKMKSNVFPLSKYWRGGSESVVFNQLELMANQPRQRTPVLGAGITHALNSRYLRNSSFLTSRVNWSIQSSGVDYLHLLIASMYYLTYVYNIDARLLLSVHDEVRFLVKEEDSRRAAFALQVANLWTRAMFCQQLGFDNMPASIAFFSLVDIDDVLRKEANDPCITPSHPQALAAGDALNMENLAERCHSLGEANKDRMNEFKQYSYKSRIPVLSEIDQGPSVEDYLRAQIGTHEEAMECERHLVHLGKERADAKKGVYAPLIRSRRKLKELM